MNVKNAIKIALAGAAVACGSAHALTPAAVHALGAGNVIYVSGSTATDAAIQAWAKLDPAVDASAPFAAGSYDLIKTASGYIIAGTANGAVFAGLGGQGIAIIKQTKGGSALGIHPVAAGTTAAGFADIANAGFVGSCGAAVGTGASNPFQAFNTYTCTQAEISLSPNAGISDEDPTTWIGGGAAPNVVTASDAAAPMVATPGVQVPFGIIVSVMLRNALQTQEGLVSGSDALANVPSLTQSQVRALLTQQIVTWNNLNAFNPGTGAITTVDATGSFVHVCRRGDTSGSEFAAAFYFLGQHCSKGNGVSAIANPDDTNAQANGNTWVAAPADDADGVLDLGQLVFAGSGTGDVRSCVAAPTDNAANGDAGGTDSTTGGTDAFNGRIGFVSMDQVPPAAGVDASGNPTGWRYVALNGQLPSIWNIQLGQYDFITEDTFNNTPASLNLNGGPGNHAAIWNGLKGNFANINGLSGLNAATRNAAAPADATGAADTGLVTLGAVGTPTLAPSHANGWPLAIRSIAVANKGPYSYVSKTFTSVNNCNAPFAINPNL